MRVQNRRLTKNYPLRSKILMEYSLFLRTATETQAYKLKNAIALVKSEFFIDPKVIRNETQASNLKIDL